VSDFQFLKNPLSHKWVILAPRRAKRPDIAKGTEPVCPFCLGKESTGTEAYRVPSSVIASEAKQSNEKEIVTDSLSPRNDNADWLVRVIYNKFPFAPIHEVVIHSPDHHKNFDELPASQVELILDTYRKRYNLHKEKGQIYIFHNRGEAAGESLPHPHSQLAVLPFEVKMDIPRLDPIASSGISQQPLSTNGTEDVVLGKEMMIDTKHFYLFCPNTSQWPDEVWIAPQKRGRAFGEITDEEITDLAATLARVIQIFDLRHGHEFPFNFYIYPGGDWYLRLVPRLKTLGGFEIGTGVFVNTQDPQETMKFLKEHFESPDVEKIKTDHQADYSKHA